MRTTRESRAAALLHPVRFRIVSLLSNGDVCTAGDVAQRLSDVPTATIYRQFNRLIDAGVLVSAGQRKGARAPERLYRLDGSASLIPKDELETMGAREAQSLFATFIDRLSEDFARYTKGAFSIAHDRVRFNKVTVHVTRDEYAKLLSDMDTLIASYNKRGSNAGKQTIALTLIAIPEKERSS